MENRIQKNALLLCGKETLLKETFTKEIKKRRQRGVRNKNEYRK